MQARTIVSSLVLATAFAGSAFAETPNAVPQAAFSASKSRAEVQAELHAYKQAGVNPWSTTYNPLRSFRSTTGRDAVVAAYIASRDEVHALTGEDSGSAYLAQARVPGMRADTLAGTPQAAH